MTWLQRSLPLRPACLLSACSGLSTPRFGRSDLSSRLGSATGCSSACPDRTLTCKKNTSSSGRTIAQVYRRSNYLFATRESSKSQQSSVCCKTARLCNTCTRGQTENRYEAASVAVIGDRVGDQAWPQASELTFPGWA